MYRDRYPDKEGNVKRVVVLLAGVFIVALVVVMGTRMSSDAIGVLVGVIAGVAASVPTALLLIAVTRPRADEEPQVYEERRQMTPPVIVVAPGSAPQVMPQYGGAYPQQLSSAPGRRRFRVMGYDDESMEPIEGRADDDQAWYSE